MADVTRRGGKKNRKHGRNKRAPANERYKTQQRWAKNKLKRVRKRCKQHPNDSVAAKCLRKLQQK